jgi:hypothetical protein
VGITSGTTPEVIRTIKGVGEIQARECSVAPPTLTKLSFKNTSGETLKIWVDRAGNVNGVAENPEVFTEPNGGTQDITTALETAVRRLHIFPADGSKGPQARVTLSHQGSATTCNDVHLAVLNWSTRE